MNLPSNISADTRQNLPSGFTYDNTVILSSMLNDGTGWQLSEPSRAFITGIMNTNLIYVYARTENVLSRPVKVVIGRY